MAARGNKGRFVIEQHSSYYLHSSSGPGIMITAVVFDKSDYDLWERVVRTTLKAKNELGFIEGTITKATVKEKEEFLELDTWEMANSTLYSWMLNVVNPKLRMSVAYLDMAHGM